MKNLFLLAILFFGLNIQAQKTFKIFNYTANTFVIQDLVTRSFTAPSTYALPEFHSKPSPNLTIAPYATYTLLNTSNATRFPFYAPVATGGSLPLINTWERLTTAGTTVMAGAAAWIIGSTQVFYRIQLGFGASSFQIGIAPGTTITSTIGGVTATYTVSGTIAAPIYTITIL